VSRPSWDETWMSVAASVALRSRCSVRRVGAVVVGPGNRDHWVGYNGPPAGLRLPPEPVGQRAGQGCSNYCQQGETAPDRDLWLVGAGSGQPPCVSVHAEVNALMQSHRDLRAGGTVYVTAAPCWKCALAVMNSGVARAVFPPYEQGRRALGLAVTDTARACGVGLETWEKA
jgi:dCMP deaminase